MAEAPGWDVLRLEGVSAGYDNTVVLEDIDLALAQGESLSIIGRNGVGKTTLLATIMGHTRLHGGRIALFGSDAAPLAIHERARAGVGFIPQEREIFPSLTVVENLEVGARPGAWNLDRVFDLFPPLAQRRRNRGNQLSGGEQQMLAIGRALMGNPTLLLMDEPSEGLAPVIVESLFASFEHLRGDRDLAIVLVEQSTRLALAFSTRTLVMDRGHIVFDGASRSLSDDAALLDRLIGVGGADQMAAP